MYQQSGGGPSEKGNRANLWKYTCRILRPTRHYEKVLEIRSPRRIGEPQDRTKKRTPPVGRMLD